MDFYKSASLELQKKLGEYKKNNEVIDVSPYARINGQMYKEVRFKSKRLQKIFKGNKGIIYIDKNDDIVSNPQVIKKLSEIFYFGEILCDSESSANLTKAIQTEIDINRDEKEYKQCIEAIKVLVNKQVNQAGQLIKLFKTLPTIKKENNEKLQAAINIAEETFVENGYLDESFIEIVRPTYISALESNFKKIKFICGFREELDYIRESTQRNKKTFRWKFKTVKVINLSKLEEHLNYLIKILATYDSILDLSKSQYEHKLKAVENENITLRRQLIRNK
ncbi:MAG: hypothetical protein RR425_05765 [Erysipelotrichales bacterium]